MRKACCCAVMHAQHVPSHLSKLFSNAQTHCVCLHSREYAHLPWWQLVQHAYPRFSLMHFSHMHFNAMLIFSSMCRYNFLLSWCAGSLCTVHLRACVLWQRGDSWGASNAYHVSCWLSDACMHVRWFVYAHTGPIRRSPRAAYSPQRAPPRAQVCSTRVSAHTVHTHIAHICSSTYTSICFSFVLVL